MPLKLELPDGTQVPIALHALERWREYVCPMAKMSDAIALLVRFVEENGMVTPLRPAWIDPTTEAALWVEVGDFCLPIAEPRDGSPYQGSAYFIPTVYARGNVGPDERARRSDRRRGRRHSVRLHASSKQGDRRGGFRASRRALRAPDVDQWT